MNNQIINKIWRFYEYHSEVIMQILSQVLVLLKRVVMTMKIKVFSRKKILRKTTLNFIQKLVALMQILFDRHWIFV